MLRLRGSRGGGTRQEGECPPNPRVWGIDGPSPRACGGLCVNPWVWAQRGWCCRSLPRGVGGGRPPPQVRYCSGHWAGSKVRQTGPISAAGEPAQPCDLQGFRFSKDPTTPPSQHSGIRGTHRCWAPSERQSPQLLPYHLLTGRPLKHFTQVHSSPSPGSLSPLHRWGN